MTTFRGCKMYRQLRRRFRVVASAVSRAVYVTRLYAVVLKLITRLIVLTDYRSAFVFNVRPMWLCQGAAWDKRLPLRIEFCAPDTNSEAGIVPRISATFCANAEQNIGAERGLAAVWSSNLSKRWGTLLSALWARDHSTASRLFARMFREDFIWGLTYGSEVDRWPHRRSFFALNILTALVEFAEALGVSRAETPEQGMPYWELQQGAEQLVKKIRERHRYQHWVSC